MFTREAARRERDGMGFLYVVDVCVMNTPTTGWGVAYTHTQVLESLFVYFYFIDWIFGFWDYLTKQYKLCTFLNYCNHLQCDATMHARAHTRLKHHTTTSQTIHHRRCSKQRQTQSKAPPASYMHTPHRTAAAANIPKKRVRG